MEDRDPGQAEYVAPHTHRLRRRDARQPEGDERRAVIFGALLDDKRAPREVLAGGSERRLRYRNVGARHLPGKDRSPPIPRVTHDEGEASPNAPSRCLRPCIDRDRAWCSRVCGQPIHGATQHGRIFHGIHRHVPQQVEGPASVVVRRRLIRAKVLNREECARCAGVGLVHAHDPVAAMHRDRRQLRLCAVALGRVGGRGARCRIARRRHVAPDLDRTGRLLRGEISRGDLNLQAVCTEQIHQRGAFPRVALVVRDDKGIRRRRLSSAHHVLRLRREIRQKRLAVVGDVPQGDE